jgi:hypothetical protein
MATTIGNLITLDGQFTDWPTADAVMTPANTVSGYQLYGALLNDTTLGNNYVIGIDATGTTDPVIGANTFIYLNTDQDTATGFSPFGTVGAEYYVEFSPDSNSVLQPYLYSVTSAGVTTELNGAAPLNFGASSDGESVEVAIPQALLTPSGGTAPSSVNFAALINNGTVALPGDFSNPPQYAITVPVKIGDLITLDGQFTDWPAADAVMTPANAVSGYQLYGALLNDATLGKNYVVGIDATAATDPAIAANTFIYLNTDQNKATGYSPFGGVGAEDYVQFAPDSHGVLQPYLYSVTSAGVATQLNGGAPLHFGVSSNGESVEVAIPQALLTPSGGTAPTSISFTALINNGSVALPGDFTNPPQYNITDPSTLVPVDHAIKKVGIVYSATTAALYFGGGQAGETAYSDLFMAAQHQAEAAGVSYDMLTEADLTNVAKLSQYSALIFPDTEDVQSGQVSAISNALNQVVYNYHVPIITAGNFMTNDETGAPLAGNSYVNMQTLLNLTPNGSGTATYSVTADAAALANHNPIVAGYTAGELIGGASGQFAGTTAGLYTNTGYQTFSGITQPATVLADINIQGGASVPGVVQTTTGGTNTVFATTGLLGDSNLLQHVIQNTVFGTTPSLSIDITRMAGVVDSRTDMDQSQFPSDVSPGAGQPGIYDALIPMLQQWKQQYNFVGSYYINVGDDANPANGNSTNWAVSAPYYKAIIALGSEIGNHSYTHLVNPPTVDANGNPVPVDSSGSSTWDENTNTLYVTPPANGSAPNWTFAYEFGQSKTIEQQNLGITIAGAAVPGANDTVATAQQIEQYYQSVAGGLTGYVNGGWTGVGSGAPNAFGYLTPSDTGSVYIAPNITFDFTEVQYDNKTAAQALADWETLFNQLSDNSDVPVIVWPWHDYGPTDWNTNGSAGAGPGPGYTAQMYADFIAYAYNAGYEFVTSEDLAARIAAQQKATLSETTSGNVITATITPDATAPDLGSMALNVVNGAAGQVIQNAGNWYAYDSNSIFLPYGGGTFNITLGTTQDDVTHIDALPMRADLKSVTGDGSNLTFAMTGDGVVDIHVKTPGANIISVQGAPAATLTGADLSLAFNDGALAVSATSPQGAPVLHTVSIFDGATAVLSTGTNILFGGSGTNVLDLTGLYENYTTTLNGDGSDTIVDTRTGTPDGTDIAHNFQNFHFTDGLDLTASQLTGVGVVLGTSSADTLTSALTGEVILGLAGNDTLTAGAANQVLDGGTGANVFNDGGFGGVTLIGDGGNDTFVVNNATTTVLEMPNANATVITTLSNYTLSANIQTLTYTGTGNFTGQGNDLGDTITGGSGADHLIGGLGNDTLKGSAGDDTLDGGAGTNTAVYSGLRSDYQIDWLSANSISIVDMRSGSPDGSDTVINVQSFRFADNTYSLAQLAPDHPPVLTVPSTNVAASAGQSLSASSLFSATDLDGDTLTYYIYEDTTAANAGHFVVAGTVVPAQTVYAVTAAQLAQTTFVAGAPGTSADLYAIAYDGQAYSGNGKLTEFHVNVAGSGDHAPVLTVPSADVAASAGEALSASSLFSATDVDGDTLSYYIYDATTAANSGHFVVNGTVVPAGNPYAVTAAQLAQTTFVAGAAGTSDDLYAIAYDGQEYSGNGKLTEFHVNVAGAVDHAPVLTVPSTNVAATAGETLSASSLFSATDADGDTLSYYIYEDTTAANAGHFVVDGTVVPAQTAYAVTAAQLAQTTFVAGAAGTSADLYAIAYDGQEYSGNGKFTEFHVDVAGPADHAPVLTVPSANVAASPGQSLSASSLFSATDADGDPLSYYIYEDTTAANAGHFVVDGTAVPAQTVYAVTAAQLAQTTFVAGAPGTSADLYAIAYDGQEYSGNGKFTEFHVNVPGAVDHAPVLTVPSANVAASAGQSLPVSSLFSATDVDGDTLSYYIYDATTAANSGHFVVNGTVVPAGNPYAVTAAQLAQTTFVAGAAGTSDDLYAIAYDGQQYSGNGKLTEFHVNVPATTAPAVDFHILV